MIVKNSRVGECCQLEGMDLGKPVFKSIVEILINPIIYANSTMLIT